MNQQCYALVSTKSKNNASNFPRDMSIVNTKHKSVSDPMLFSKNYRTLCVDVCFEVHIPVG